MKKQGFVLGVLAMALTFGLVFAGCSKKDSGGGSGGGGVSATVSVPKAGKAAPASDFSYDLSKDDGGKSVVIKTYTGNGGALVIPAEIEGLPVSTLGSKAFIAGEYGTEPGANITSVVIPASVKFIDHTCFNGNENLTSVTILGTGVEIRQYAFRDCINLTELKIPDGDNVLSPGKYNSDQEDVIGDAGEGAFRGCKKLPLAMRSRLNAMGFTDI